MNGAAMPKKVWRDTIGLSTSGGLVQLLSAARALLGARALGPTLYGVWQGLRFLLQLARYSSAGSLEGIKRELPIARGKGDEKRQAELRGSALVAALLLVSPIVVGCIAAGFFVSPEWSAAFWALALAALLGKVSAYFGASLRAEARMQRSAVAGFMSALVAAALAWPLARAFGVAGFIGSAIVGSAVAVVVAFRRRPMRVSRAIAVDVIRSGFPIRLAQAARGLSRSAEKLIVLAAAGPAPAGLFGLADTAARLMLVLPNSFGSAVAPHALERFGRSGDREELLAALAGPLDAASRTLPLVLGLAAVFCEPTIAWLLPDFVAATTTTKILLLLVPSAAVQQLSMNILVALGRQKSAAAVRISTGVVTVALDLLVLRLGLGIEAVAVVSVGMSGVAGLAFAGLAGIRLGIHWKPEVKPSLYRLAYGIGAFLSVEVARDLIPGGAAGRAAALVVLTAPLLIRRAAARDG